jgi:HK97 family phage prohead protease
LKTAEYRATRSPVKCRAASDGKPAVLFGYAATFNSPSQDLGGFVEVLAPGCFTRTLQTADVRAFWNHVYDDLLGRTKSGTLRLVEDAVGLGFENDVPDTTVGRDTYVLVNRGDVDGVSFGFYSIQDEWSADGLINTILEAELIEISPVVFPAYLNGPKVEARSFNLTNPDRLARRPKPRFRTLERAKSIIRLDNENF